MCGHPVNRDLEDCNETKETEQSMVNSAQFTALGTADSSMENKKDYLLRIRQGAVEDICIIKVDGRITLGDTSSAFRNLFHQVIAEGYRKFVLDFSEVTFLDSAGIGELVGAATRSRMRTGKIILIQGSGDMQEVMQVTKLGAVFERADDVSEGVNRFRIGSKKPFPPEIEYEEKYAAWNEKDENGKSKYVCLDNISNEPARTEYNIREIPPNDSPQKLSPVALLVATLVAFAILSLTLGGLVWVTKVVSSITLLVLVFTLALLIFLLLCSVVLLLSGHLSEKAATKLFGGILGKLPGLSAWVPKGSKPKAG